MKISIGSDHGGFEQKQMLVEYLKELGHEVVDCGPDTDERCDYPDYAKLVCDLVVSGEVERGILVCGTGVGMSIAANKIDGIRCANITNPDFAVLCREHNDANVISLSGRFVIPEDNKEIIDAFLTTEFAGGRHVARIEKIMALQ